MSFGCIFNAGSRFQFCYLLTDTFSAVDAQAG